MWQSPDPALEAFLNATKTGYSAPRRTANWRTELNGPGMGGAFNPKNLNGFAYVHQNPVKHTDPTGEGPWDVVFVAYDVYAFVKEPSWENGIALGLDAISTVSPVEAAGTIYRGVKIAERAAGALKGAERGREGLKVAEEGKALNETVHAVEEAKTAEQRAKEIHGAVNPVTQGKTTIAVTETEEGVRVVSSSEKTLRPVQRKMLKEGKIEGVVVGHAETTGIKAARESGLTPTGTAASRPICPNCAKALENEGVKPLSPLKE